MCICHSIYIGNQFNFSIAFKNPPDINSIWRVKCGQRAKFHPGNAAKTFSGMLEDRRENTLKIVLALTLKITNGQQTFRYL